MDHDPIAAVLCGDSRVHVAKADALEFLRALPPDSVDLVFGSPSYEEARLYLENGVNVGISCKTPEWVQWMADVHEAAQKACKGLVAFVVAGQTKKFRWSAGPVLLMAELHRRGLNLRNPPIFHRVGIPGSGGPDWLRADYEFIICTTQRGRLPCSDNTAMGHPPKWAPGGEMSHRLSDGQRVNQWGKTGTESVNGHAQRKKDGKRQKASRPSHTMTTKKQAAGYATSGHKDGDTPNGQGYDPPTLANPGNSIERTYTAAEVAALLEQHADWRHYNVGGGQMGGDEHAKQNEAPFPEALAEFFIRSFARPDGLVVDPFCGSGTTAAVALRHGRRALACDIRQSQVDLANRRLLDVTPLALFGE